MNIAGLAIRPCPRKARRHFAIGSAKEAICAIILIMEKKSLKAALRGRPVPVIVLIAVNIVLFLITELAGPTEDARILIRFGALYTPAVADGEYWRLLMAMFLHSGIRHLLNNMLNLYILGELLLRETGTPRFLLFYFCGGIAGNIAEYALSVARGENVIAVGASGAVFALMGSLLAVLIKNRGRIRGMTMQRMITFIILSVYFGFAAENVANAAHLAGLAAGFVLAMLFVRRKEKLK